MALILSSEVLSRARRVVNFSRTASMILNEHVEKQAEFNEFDIFLSHAFGDKELVLGIALLIEELGYRVYLDWRDDPKLDRSNVSAGTANVLRTRMKESKSLFFATTPNFEKSQWMPWELGYKDGHNCKTAILPIVDQPSDAYAGKEYLGLYPYVDLNGNKLWINRTVSCYVSFDGWLKGTEPTERK